MHVAPLRFNKMSQRSHFLPSKRSYPSDTVLNDAALIAYASTFATPKACADWW